MTLFDKLSVPGRSGSDFKTKNSAPDEAWRPRMDVGDDGGYVISIPRPISDIPDAKELLIEFNLNPEHWAITSVRKSRWQRYDGELLESQRINIVPIASQTELDLDVKDLMKSMQNWKPGKKPLVTTGDLAFIFAPSDQQLGKKANGEGTKETVERIQTATEGAVHRLHDLRKVGRGIGTVVIALLGDHVEGTVSQGGRLQSHAASDMGLTEQIRVGIGLLMIQIKAFAPLVDRIVVAVVNGNHDEVSRQVALDPSEGWNTHIANVAQSICAEGSALSHVEFRFPAKDHQTLAVEVCGTMIGLFHGHQSGRDVTKYLSEQAAGQTALGGCDVWLSGHFHSFRSMDVGGRFWAQCPTVDPGSAWFRDRRGLESNPGILTMVVGKDHDPRLDVSVIPANK